MQDQSLSMKRKVIAAVWVSGATIPLLLGVVFLVGCCVLPFHGVMHKLMPLCEMAANVIRGDDAGHEHEHDAVPPAREKQEPVKRIATTIPVTFHPFTDTADGGAYAPTAATAYRSFISQGAVRCDQDVGLHLLVATFLI